MNPAVATVPSGHVLLIEDDEQIGARVGAALRAAGYSVRWCRTGLSGLAEARATAPEIVLLDLGLPDGDGLDVARAVRAGDRDVVVVILTARDDDIDVIAGLDAGADDYLTKPFSTTVLLARLRAHTRRRPISPQVPPVLDVGDLEVDMGSRRCHLATTEISLRSKEFDLLTVLASHAGEAVSRADLMAEVWDEHWHGSTKTLDVTVASLRARLAEAARDEGRAAPAIVTLRGHGYRLDPARHPRDATSSPGTTRGTTA